MHKKHLTFSLDLHTVENVRIEFDPAKEKLNLNNHGLSLYLAENLDWPEALAWLDVRYHYDEYRYNALVPGGDYLYHVTFIDCGEVYRIISLRFATFRERRKYVRDYA